MKRQEIEKAAVEARRFLARVEDFYKRKSEIGDVITIVGYKETEALRRASLDLSRALADMRKP